MFTLSHLNKPGQSPHLKILILITSAESILPGRGTHSQVLGIRHGNLAEPLILSTTVQGSKTTLTHLEENY